MLFIGTRFSDRVCLLLQDLVQSCLRGGGLILEPLHRSGYASLGRVCTLGKVRTIRGSLEGLALMI